MGATLRETVRSRRPTPDSVNAGRTIPIKWTVTGADVSDTTVVSGAFIDLGATYDMVRSGSTWHVNATTPKSWAGTTRTFGVVLDDLSAYEFDVVFRWSPWQAVWRSRAAC
jgi:hypothetical protein